MKNYVMKDLGYPRTATDAAYRIEMPDDSVWSVPVQLIVDDRDQHYSDEKEDTIGYVLDGSLSEYEIKDWARNNMNWSDVSDYALKLDRPTPKVDYQDGWVNGSSKIRGLR